MSLLVHGIERAASKTKIGYEIPFTRYFYTYEPSRPLAQNEDEIQELLREVLG